jgi:hypothetical protein
MEQKVSIFFQKSAAPTHVTYFFFRVLFVRADPHRGGGVSHCYEHICYVKSCNKHLSGVANSKAELAILLALKDAIRLFKI